MSYIPRKQDLPYPKTGVVVKYNEAGNTLYIVNNPIASLEIKNGDYLIVSYTPEKQNDNHLPFVIVQAVCLWSQELEKMLPKLGISKDNIRYHGEDIKGFFKHKI